MSKDYEIKYAPGCFDNFDGTQEELDALVAEIEKSIEDGSIFENSVPLEDMKEESLINLLRTVNYSRTIH